MISHLQLEQFGLNQKEAKVYLAALGLGVASVQSIAKKADIHRVTVYDILETLISKGLIQTTATGKKRQFQAVEPEKILQSLKDKENIFAELLPELKAMQDKGQTKPKVMYFEGREAFWQAYQDRIRHMPELKENLMYGSSEKLLNTFPEGYRRFTKERLAKGIRAKIIVERSSSGLKESQAGGQELREVKFWPAGMSLNASNIIYGNRVMIISWESMLLVIIEDKNYAENQRKIFNLLWQQLPSE